MPLWIAFKAAPRSMFSRQTRKQERAFEFQHLYVMRLTVRGMTVKITWEVCGLAEESKKCIKYDEGVRSRRSSFDYGCRFRLLVSYRRDHR